VDPDPRFTLANERTFLAWMRTSMGLTAGAVGLEAFASDTVGGALRLILVLGLLAGAAVLAVFAFARWLAIEAAMRRGRSLPFPGTAAVLASVAGGVASALLVVVALR
jgi:putative membrane protein